jgi:dTDP-4-dehydrorhamnose 3,5-epimerase
MTLNYAVPVGRVRLVLFDDRETSPTRGAVQEIALGDTDYSLVRIPPGIWNGVLGIGDEPAVIANCATEPHDPDEIVRRPARDPFVPYEWGEISPHSG